MKNENIHILLCDKHKTEEKIVKLLEDLKTDSSKIVMGSYLHVLRLTFFSGIIGVASMDIINSDSIEGNEGLPDITECAIFQLQTIEIEGIKFNLFFDSGCGDILIKKSAVVKLEKMGRAKQILSGPLEITGVGEKKSILRMECLGSVYLFLMGKMLL